MAKLTNAPTITMAIKVECSLEFHRNPKPDCRRGLAFLIFPDNEEVTARIEFDGFKDNDKRWFQSIFDLWLDGSENRKAYFHRWDKSEFNGKYTNIFVFKHRGHKHRLYGFLCHPNPMNSRYHQCVLVNYASKGKWETDEYSLKVCESKRCDVSVQRDIKRYFHAGGPLSEKH